MSAIFGIINTDDKPVTREELVQMQQPMLYWGPDGQYLWNENNAGLGHLQLHNTPESVNETFPLFDNSRGLVFISSARIDNRDELFKHFGIFGEEARTITDAQLIFNAYLKWGSDSVNRLLGDWCFAVWDKLEKKLFMARDHMGASGIYYCLIDKKFIFSSSLKGILALPISFKPNMLRLGEIAAGAFGDGITTCYENIFRIPPSQYLELKEGNIKKTTYWTTDQVEPMKQRSFSDLADEFSDILFNSVNCRIRTNGPYGSMLSGGLDSGTVSVVAAKLLKERGEQLTSFTSVPLFPLEKEIKNRFTDEGSLAKKVAEMSGNINHILIDAADYSPIKAIEECIKIHDEPIRNIGNLYWIFAIYQRAKELGIKTLFTAGNGNATLSFPPLFYFNTSLKKRILLQLPIKYRIYKISNRQLNSSFVNKTFAQEFKLANRLCQLNKTYRNVDNIQATFNIMLKPATSNYGYMAQQHKAYFGINFHDPSNDKRLIKFSMALVKSADNKKSIFPRDLLIANMKNYLPNEVLNNSLRGIQAVDLYTRTKKNSNELNSRFENINSDNMLNYISDKEKLNKIYNHIDNSSKGKYLRSDIICFYRFLAIRWFLHSKLSHF